MPLRVARSGVELKVLQRKVDYSFWPMGRTTRRYGLQSRVSATDPWAVIRHSIDQRCPAVAKQQAQSFRAQAQDYFKAAEVASLFTTRPLLLYYSFLNLAKAFTLTQGARQEYAAAYHGLKEKIHPASGRELYDSVLEAVPSGTKVIVTPHTGSHTDEATNTMGWMSLEACLAVLGGERPAHVVNPEVYQR